MNRKALSDVITNVLIVLIVIVSIGIIATFVFQIINSSVEKSGQQNLCLSLDVHSVKCSLEEVLKQGTTRYNVSVLIERGAGKEKIESGKIIIEMKDGKTEIIDISTDKINGLTEFATISQSTGQLVNYKPSKAGVSVKLQGMGQSCPESGRVECQISSVKDLDAVVGGPAVPFVMPPGTVSFVTLNETSGNLAFDSSDTTHRGQLSGAGFTFSSSSISGKANSRGLRFDGVDDFIIFSPAGRMPVGGNSRTVMVWINYTGNGGPIYQFYSSSGQRFNLQMSDYGAGRYLLFSGGNLENDITITGTEMPLKNQWNHIAFVVRDSTHWEYYLNGALIKTGTFSTTLNTGFGSVAMIGRTVTPPYFFYKGDLDEFIIFNRVLTSQEIKSIYDASK